MSKKLLSVLVCFTAAIVIFGSILTPGALAALSAQRGLYAVDDSTDSFYKIDPDSGVTTLIGSSVEDFSFSGLAYDTSTGTMYVSDVTLVGGEFGLGTIDLANGEVTIIGSHVISFDIPGLAYDSLNDILFGSDLVNDGLASIDRTTGAATSIGLFIASTSISGLAYSPVNDTLYGINTTNLYTINRTTGEATVVGAHGITTGYNVGLEYDENTGRLYAGAGGNPDLYVLDINTGSASSIGPTGIQISGLASIPAVGSRSVLYINTMGGSDSDFVTGLQGMDIDGLTLVDARYMTPSTAYMQKFDVVLVSSGGAGPIADPVILGDNLAACVDTGGGVCLSVPTLYTALGTGLGGEITTPAYSPMSPVGGGAGGASTSVSFETHPITSGVTSLSTSLPLQFTSTQGTGQSLGDYDTGYLLGAYSPDKPIAVINVFP